jgi:hypothetical protein
LSKLNQRKTLGKTPRTDVSNNYSEKPNLHLFTKNFMLPIKQNDVLG